MFSRSRDDVDLPQISPPSPTIVPAREVDRPAREVDRETLGYSLPQVQSAPRPAREIGSKITLLSLLGRGSYGSVYACQDEFGARLAIKCIETDGASSGIPCLMETSIMSIIHHPYLQKAISVHASPKMLYIISELATSDLSRYLRLKENLPSPTLLRKWAFCLLQAVACLHRKDIIHGDIKASNILLFDNEVIRLTDFTLSVYKLSGGHNHTVCTSTHRPLEVWLNREWDTPVDIWSLGCSLYEIAYGRPLFTHNTLKEGSMLREQMVNCLLDWAERGPGGRQSTTVSRSDHEYTPFHLSDRFYNSEYVDFNALILSMLKLDPSERPTASDLLAHGYFKPLYEGGIVPFMIISTPVSPLSDRDVAKLTRALSRLGTQSTVDGRQSKSLLSLSIELYSRCLGIRMDNHYLKLMACYWIAFKLIYRVSPNNLDLPLTDILAMERTICSHLSFRLHMPAKTEVLVYRT